MDFLLDANMNPEQLLQHFDRISEAPNAIPRLWRFILDLAVRGKLVEQDPNDEPAAELIGRIRGEKIKLVNEGKIRPQEALPAIKDGEIAYELPIHWEPVRIRDILTVIRGASPRPKGDPKYFSAERTPHHWIKISDIRKHSKNRILYDTDEFLTKAGMEKSVILPKGTLVMTNSATIGIPIFLGFDGGCIHDGYLAYPYFPDSEISRDFFFVLLQTLESYAIKMARDMAQLNLNTGLVRNFPLGLPPLAEQYRIVAKVDELMALCDRLEAAQTERERSRDRLVAASLQQLQNPADPTPNHPNANHHAATPAEFAPRREALFLQNLPRLTTRPAHIKQLRQTILNLAVRGKLVPQDPNDEPAAELIKRIQTEKTLLIKEGKIRKQEKLPAIKEAEKYFSDPMGWSWEKLGNISKKIHYGFTASSDPSIRGVRLLRITDIQDNSVDWPSVPGCDIAEDDIPQYKLECGDILVARTGGTIGKTFLVDQIPVIAIFASYLIRIQGASAIYDRYLKVFMESPVYWTQLQDGARGAGQPNVNGQTLGKMSVPIPPSPNNTE